MDKTLENKGKRGFWNFIDNLKGDKVIWMIVLLLMLLSMVTVFSATSAIAVDGTTRIDYFLEQFYMVCAGLAVILVCYNIPSIGLIRVLSFLGFPLSLVLLIMLTAGVNAVTINGATRAIMIGSFQVHVFEVVKVAMVVYLASAIHSYKENAFGWVDRIVDRYGRGKWMKSLLAKRMAFIYLPIIIVLGLMFKGGISSTMFTGLVMFLTILIGGMPKKEVMGAVLLGAAMIGLFVGIHFASHGKVFPRIGTAINRLTMSKEYEILETRSPKTVEFREALDKVRQPEGAKIAVKEGGFLGKGPGNSTQKYTVFALFSDYMYAFIIEEYGLLMGIVVLLLYVSLLARGSMIVRLCDSTFARTAVAGLVLLISGQAFMHMMISVNIGPLTGQTLPLVSHGSSSFLSFSVAFGVLLSISRLAKEKMDEKKRRMEEDRLAAEAEAAAMEADLESGIMPIGEES